MSTFPSEKNFINQSVQCEQVKMSTSKLAVLMNNPLILAHSKGHSFLHTEKKSLHRYVFKLDFLIFTLRINVNSTLI